jgi:hypothetical protein
MILAVLFVIVAIALIGWPSSIYLVRRLRGLPLRTIDELRIVICIAAAMTLSIVTWLTAMRSGVRALEEMDRR